jgi:predicted peroxiredoxin
MRDAGHMGCGELVLQLRGRLADLAPGALFELVAHDQGAPEDLPSWCRLTGHKLVSAEHPTCVSITNAKNDPDRATVGFVIANAAVGSDQETVVFVSTEGVRLVEEGYADDIAEESFAPLKELMTNYVEAGGTIWVCSPCFKKRSLDETKLVKGATIVGGAKLVELLAGGAPCVTY